MFVDTPNQVLTFNISNLLKQINVAYYKLKVRSYIPPSIRCFNCQRFGHLAVKCTREKLCLCGKRPHDNACNKKECVNFNGPYSAGYKNCPKYKEKTAIQKVKTTEKVTYSKAKRRVQITTTMLNVIYAAATNNQNALQQKKN